MKSVLSLIMLTTSLLFAFAPASASAQAEETDAVNRYCPISREANDGKTFMSYKGNKVGFCCPSCDEKFMGWDDERRDVFITKALANEEPRIIKAAATEGETSPDDAIIAAQLMHYPLDTCIVSGQALGSMGEPFNYVHEGRLVRFCCAGCIERFEAEPAKFITALDEKIVSAQVASYPMTTCVIGGGELSSMGEPLNYFYENRLVRFCCAGCIAKFDADPDTAMAKIDAAYADQQRADYPLDYCPVMGDELGSDEEVVEVIVGNQLVRLCCNDCVKDVQADPSSFIAKINAAKK